MVYLEVKESGKLSFPLNLINITDLFIKINRVDLFFIFGTSLTLSVEIYAFSAASTHLLNSHCWIIPLEIIL